MPAKEIKELRQAGRLQEAFEMAKSELENSPDDIWAKRNIVWVHYEFVKQNADIEYFNVFCEHIECIIALHLPEDDKMVFDNTGWQIIKIGFSLLKQNNYDNQRFDILLNLLKELPITKPSEVYSALFKIFHKAYKDNYKYTSIADWWNFENFLPNDFQKEKMENGKEVMALAEQAYIAYAKHILPKQLMTGEIIFDKQKALDFLPKLELLSEHHPEYQYPPYFQAKLLLALGDKDNMLSTLIPFAKKKSNDFWVWDILSEAFTGDEDKIFSLYCRGLLCKAPDEMLVNLREKIIPYFISRELFDAAKTEIQKVINIRKAKEWKISNNLIKWQNQPWFPAAQAKSNNADIYRKYLSLAEEVLYSDIPTELVFIDYVNTDKYCANYIDKDFQTGFLKYDRYTKKIKTGDVVKVRFQQKKKDGLSTLISLEKVENNDFKSLFVKDFEGAIAIREGNQFGFVKPDIFVSPEFCKKYNLSDGQYISGISTKTYNKKKERWGWTVININL